MPTTYILSPNMSLPVPEISIAPGPDYASDINNCMAVLDQHTHAFGSGIAVTPDGLNINTDLTFQGNNITFLKTVQFVSQLSTIPAVTPYIDCLYVSGVDLYYNDGANNIVRITQSGGVAGSPGSIANLTSPASASYVSGDQTFVWESAANTAANMDFGAATFRNITAGSNGITISPPSALATSYGIQLFPALPSAPAFVTIDSAGNLAATVSTAGGITIDNLALPNIVVSGSSGPYFGSSITFSLVTNFSLNITVTTGNVQISFQPDGNTTNPGQIGCNGTQGSYYLLRRDGIDIALTLIQTQPSGLNLIPPGALNFLDINPGSGVHTYDLQFRTIEGSADGYCAYMKMVVAEVK